MVPSVPSIPAQSSTWAKTDARGRRLDIERQLPTDEQTLAAVWRSSSAPFLLPIRRRTTASRTDRRYRQCPGDPRRSLRRCPIEDSGDPFHIDSRDLSHLGTFEWRCSGVLNKKKMKHRGSPPDSGAKMLVYG